MNETFEYLKTHAAFPFALRRFLAGGPLTVADARQIVRERVAQREENFLTMVERCVYGQPRSPYLPLLRQAGCEFGDVRGMVQRDGVEGALKRLREAGVYVTFEEFKGRKPIRRGAYQAQVGSKDFDNLLAQSHVPAETGGSSGAAQRVSMDLAHIAARAPHRLLVLAAHGLIDAPTAIWQGILPHPGLRVMLWGAYTGKMPVRWFSPVGWRASRQWPKYNLSTLYMLAAMRLAGAQVPFPQHVPVEQGLSVARWAAGAARANGRSVVRAGVSRAVRVCLEAQAADINLSGVTFTGGGEPPTEAKMHVLAEAGAHFISNYGMSEAGQVGSGCAQPLDASDVHLFKDLVALITHPYSVDAAGVTVSAFNFTALLPTAPKIMLNVQVDDYGIVEERACGCELETYGYTTHVRQIRSYGKLTGEGVTLVGSEMLAILEGVLPARFGGGPLDYQLREREDEQGFTRLYIVIHPRVAIPNERAVVDTVLTALGRSSAMADAARLMWQRAGTLRVIREEPAWTERGKLLPLHLAPRLDQTERKS